MEKAKEKYLFKGVLYPTKTKLYKNLLYGVSSFEAEIISGEVELRYFKKVDGKMLEFKEVLFLNGREYASRKQLFQSNVQKANKLKHWYKDNKITIEYKQA